MSNEVQGFMPMWIADDPPGKPRIMRADRASSYCGAHHDE